jgi:hypothetical protein
MADGEDAAVQAVQPAAGGAALDPGRAEAQAAQLVERHHTMLPRSQLGKAGIEGATGRGWAV